MRLLYLVRHGETEWNREHRLQGWVNTHLNRHGLCQAAQVALCLSNKRVGGLFTSPFPRARTMAELTAQATGLRPVVLWELREMSFGAWEGKNADEIEMISPGFKNRWLNNPYEIIFPGGDSFRNIDDRAYKLLDTFCRSENGTDAALFSHGQFIKSVICQVLDMAPSKRNQIPLKNGSITILNCSNGKPAAVEINDTSHLQASMS